MASTLMTFSGLIPESLDNYDGTDGIKFGDLKELNLDTLEFEKSTTISIVKSSLSKAKYQYFTFIPEEGITYIKEYLMEKKNNGEKFTYKKVRSLREAVKLRPSGRRYTDFPHPK
ncbi:MAG: hypothetical protein ACP5TO_03465, partial [Thermoplasmata archaeon]